MKLLIKITLGLLIVFAACKTEKKENISKKDKGKYLFLGNEMTVGESIQPDEMLTKFKNLKLGDTIKVKYESTIKEVCTNKGCWMKLPLDQETEVMVRFKDYSFFMPLNSKGREAIVNGVAFLKEVSVKDLRHFAEDAGKTKEEILSITEPKIEYSIEASGVLLR